MKASTFLKGETESLEGSYRWEMNIEELSIIRVALKDAMKEAEIYGHTEYAKQIRRILKESEKSTYYIDGKKV